MEHTVLEPICLEIFDCLTIKLAVAFLTSYLPMVIKLGSDTLQPNFSNGLTKLAILLNHKHPEMLCLALPACRKV